MNELKALGTARNRKIYGRHGVGGKMYGVSYANLGQLQKKIKIDHDLAVRLWASGNHDARVLATMVADPEQMDSKTLEAWAGDLDNYVLTDAFSGLAARSRHAEAKLRKWSRSRKEWLGSAGWNLLAHLAMQDDALADEFFGGYLETIEGGIHQGRNRARHAMNNALIAIGIRNGRLHRQAVATAKRIGKVEVDHGQTSCKTPEAVPYMEKTLAHQRKRKRC